MQLHRVGGIERALKRSEHLFFLFRSCGFSSGIETRNPSGMLGMFEGHRSTQPTNSGIDVGNRRRRSFIERRH
jgi:hypothetical protein